MIRFFFLFALFSFSIIQVHAADALNSSQEEEVRKLVRDTLLANPEILVEAMGILQARQEQARIDQQKSNLKHLSSNLKGPITPTDGNPDGDVTMIEFFDYQCGFCKKAFPGVMQVLKEDKNLNYVFKEFAILGPESEIAARAALASQKQGKYKQFHVALMTVRGRLSEDKIMKTAKSLNLNMDQLKEDMHSDDVNDEISSTRELAQRLGITGTPAFIIGDQIIPGAVPPQALKDAIEVERKKL